MPYITFKKSRASAKFEATHLKHRLMVVFTLFAIATFTNSSHATSRPVDLHPLANAKTRLVDAETSTTDRHAEETPLAITIGTLLAAPETFDRRMITVRGTITQPELHLDDSRLFFRFVFVLKDDPHTLIVFGLFDRTQGTVPIAMGNQVEVTGMFWKDRVTEHYHFTNNLEATSITPYPPMTPERT